MAIRQIYLRGITFHGIFDREPGGNVMFTIGRRRKLGFVRLKDVCYAPEPQNEEGYDAVYYFNCDRPYGRSIQQLTMLIDLSHEPHELLMSFSKNTRSEIKKAIDGGQIQIEINENPKTDEIEAYITAYNENFSAKKNIPFINQFRQRLLYELHDQDRLIMSTARARDETLCQFLLVDDGDTLICLLAYNTRFLFPEDREKNRLISRANRLLDYRSMLFAKEQQKKYYDMCGIKLTPDLQPLTNTDKYKHGFKGTIKCTYHFMLPVTFIGHLYCWAKTISESLNKTSRTTQKHNICMELNHRKENDDGVAQLSEENGIHPTERHPLRSGSAGGSS